MKKSIIHILAILLLASPISCTNNTEPEVSRIFEGATEVIDLNDVLKNAIKEKTLYISDLIDTMSVIKLETTENSLFGEIENLIVTDSHIYVLDYRKEVFIFGKDGHFIKKLLKGNGPGEFCYATSIAYNTVREELAVFSPNTLHLFTNEGDYKESLPMFNMHEAVGFKDGYVIYCEKEQVDSDYDIAFQLDNEFALVNLYEFNTGLPRLTIGENFRYYSPDELTVCVGLDKRIYSYTGDSLYAKYKIDISKVETKIDETDGKFDMKKYEQIDNQMFFYGWYLESGSYQVFTFSYYHELLMCFRNKTTGETRAGIVSNCKIENNLECLIFQNHYVNMNGDFVVVSYYPDEYWEDKVRNITASEIISQNDVSVLKNLSEDDNPAILLYRLK